MRTIRDDGLRYKSKKAGTQFDVLGKASIAKSCLLCGKHKPSGEGRMMSLAGAKQFVCLACKPAKVVAPA